ncbi:hypothetical protein V8C40DRAFT_235974 [Trichoderma camerunense]
MGPLIITTDLIIPADAIVPVVDVEILVTEKKPGPLKVKLPTDSPSTVGMGRSRIWWTMKHFQTRAY